MDFMACLVLHLSSELPSLVPHVSSFVKIESIKMLKVEICIRLFENLREKLKLNPT